MARSMSGRKVQEWQRRLRRFQKSRQSVIAFCREEGVSPPSFYLWRKRLESGTFETLGSDDDSAAVELDAAELGMLLSGVSLGSAKRRKRYARAG
jgi:hypothetical protein